MPKACTRQQQELRHKNFRASLLLFTSSHAKNQPKLYLSQSTLRVLRIWKPLSRFFIDTKSSMKLHATSRRCFLACSLRQVVTRKVAAFQTVFLIGFHALMELSSVVCTLTSLTTNGNYQVKLLSRTVHSPSSYAKPCWQWRRLSLLRNIRPNPLHVDSAPKARILTSSYGWAELRAGVYSVS